MLQFRALATAKERHRGGTSGRGPESGQVSGWATRTRCVLLGLVAVASPAWCCDFVFAPAAELPPGRIAGLEIRIGNGNLRRVKAPVGWTLAIANDPSWTSHVQGQAIVGAAFLEGLDSLGRVSVRPGPDLACGDIAILDVRLTMYRDDRLQTIDAVPGVLRPAPRE